MRHVASGRAETASPLSTDPAGQAPAAHRCVHHPFEAQALRTPQAVAVVSGTDALTYAELDAQANRLAHALLRRGAGPEVRVGICVERTGELVVGLLGILKAGAAYVPLDPNYPRERLALTLDDARAPLVVAHRRFAHLLEGHAGTTLWLDADRGEIDAESGHRPDVPTHRASLAYLIYTSGSTGRPKGVMIEHGSAVSLLDWCRRVWPAEQCGGVLGSTSIGFDMSVFEVFYTLAVGGTVIMAQNALALPHLPARDRVTLVNTVPSAAAELLRGGGIPASVRVMNLGGEALKGSLAQGLYALPHVDAVHNLYGPTEDTTYSTSLLVARGSSAEPTVGRAIDGTRIYVLDDALRPVAYGDVGEVYLAGAGLTRGYLNRPGMTAERFLPDVLALDPGARMYRVGDRGRMLPNGELEYLGRVDHQVKVRGFRVELGEIEAALLRCPGIREAVVVAPEDAAGSRQLVAYLIEDGEAEDAGAMRARLGRELPEHMLPSAFVAVDALPLTPSGKADRQALLARGWTAPVADAAFVAPAGETEQALAEIWAEVLGAGPVSADTPFYALGGHSLAAVQVASRIREAFGVEVPMAALFGSATVVSLAAVIADQAQAEAPAAFGPVLPVPRDGDLPLSYSQERVWFITRLAPDVLAYQVQGTLRLLGSLDAEALEGALNDVVVRHEAFRTTFHEVDGRPVQRIHDRWEVRLPRVDLSGAGADAEAAWIAGEFSRTFDVSQLPLIRWTLLRKGPDEHVLVHVEHHLIHDGWSFNLLLRDLLETYRARTERRDAVLPEMPVQFADYCAWQRRWMDSPEARRQTEFWRARLAGAPPVLELPTDRPRPPAQRFRGRAPRFRLDGALHRRLAARAQAEGVTLFMAMLAAFDLLLSRWSGQHDVSVGTAIAVRRQREVEQVAGMFVNAMVFRTDLSGDPTFRELLHRVRGTTLEAYANQDLPFDAVVDAVRPERHPGRNPLFQAMFSFHDSAQPDMRLPGLSAELRIPLGNGSAKFDLNVIAIPHGQDDQGDADAITLFWEYDSDLFDAATIDRMFAQYGALLHEVAGSVDQRLSRYALLDAAERDDLVHALNGTAREYPRGACIHQLVQAQAARTPDRVAVTARGETLTYAELDARADRAARVLRGLGVGAEDRVGLHLERGAGMVVAVLAVLKAGGAYVPLDPGFPAARLEYMLADCGARVLLTDSADGPVPAAPGVRVLRLEAALGNAGEGDGGPAAVPSSPEQLAYVLYTSGSTGRPKGVAVPHRAVVNFLSSMREAPGLAERDALLAVTTLSFDIAALEVFLPLVTGARVVVATRETAADPAALARAMEEHGVTAMQATPATWRMLLEGGWAGDARLKALCGGEALPAELAAALRPRVGELWNLYGPTETTIWSTAHRVESAAGTPPIGRPIANTRAFLLDAHGALVPRGSTGELHVGGDGVARGYLGRAALTAERFVPDPFASAPGGRLYRTGDLARWRRDGTLEYVGRADQQVKLRGYRIELEEVESALLRQPGVRQAVATVRDDAAGERMLAAYVVPAEGAAPTPAGLRDGLRAELPEYMVPSAVVLLPELPLTLNGKVDRRALPAPDASAAHDEPVAPRTPVEEVLAGIWGEVLGRARVGIHDDFFALGGHSLRATRVVSRVRAALGVDLPLRALFDGPTVARMAARVEEHRRGTTEDAEPITLAPRDRPLPQSFMQQRLWFLERMQPGAATYNLPMALRLRGALDADALRRALSEIVGRHEALRTTFTAVDGEPAQVVGPVGDLPLPVEDVADDGALRARLSAEARRPFDLEGGPVFRALLFRVAPDEHVLLIAMHHMAGDGWSHWVLLRELSALYPAALAGADAGLPRLAVQYADFAVWQRQRLSGNVLDGQLAYWRGRLQGAPAVLELPTDRPRPAVQTYRGEHERVEIGADLAERLRAVARREGSTLFMVLMAAWQVLLSRWSGQDDVVVGTSIAGRTRPELEPLIGFFANTLALRGDLSGDPTFGELVARVREATLGAYAHQDLPFEKLVDELQPARSLSYNPLFQAFLALDNAPSSALSMGDVAVERQDVLKGTAKFDLSLLMRERGDALEGWMEYATDLFDAPTIRRMVGHLGVLLDAVATHPERRIPDLPLLPADERAQVVTGFNPTSVDAAAVDSCLHTLFERQAAAGPDRTAIIDGDVRVSYDALNRRANQLAHHLRGRGVGPESRVGICLERGPDLLVALLAVLKAGGAYVPIDPAYPADRIAYVAGDSGIALLLTTSDLRGTLADVPVARISLDSEWGAIAVESEANPTAAGDPDNLAYVIYTSGSTGRPKGAMLSHAAVVRLFSATGEWFRFGPEDVWTLFHSSAFDFSVWEFWGPLLHGGALVVVPYLTSRSPVEFRQLLAHHRVTVLNQTPSAFQQLVQVDAQQPEPLTALRLVVFGGEALQVETLRPWLDRYGPAHPRLVNMYGITETCVHVTYHPVTGADLRQAAAGSPIGVPIPDLRLYVLDAAMNPAPIGVPGEMFVGGAGLARGYLGRPGLTAERFVPDPFGASGERLYRSGDRVRWRADGRLEYHGRIDLQVKIRGFRIEPGEIEAVLLESPRVRECVVAVVGDGGDKRLVAYVVAQDGIAPTTRELREITARRLPDHMVPAAFVLLDRLPLTGNGKVDRRALPEPDAVESDASSDQPIAPRTPVEEVLAAIWGEVLKAERIGIHDDFFALGGHSLRATQVVSRVHEVLRIDLPLRALFESPTVADLAVEAERLLRAGGGVAPPVARTADRNGPIPLSFAQRRLWFLDRMEPDTATYNVPSAIRLSGALDVPALERALGEVVRRHETLRTTFGAADGEPFQRVHPPEALALAVEALSDDGELRSRLGDEARRPFDLEHGPLFRAHLFRLGDEEHVLLLTMHHVVSDGWSTGVLHRELSALYAAFATGAEPALAELPVQYADYAVWQREHRSQGVLARQMAYWTERLAGAPPVLELVPDRPRPAVQSHRGASERVELPADLTAAVRPVARREGATLFMALLAAWQMLLSRWSGQDDFVVGAPVAGRTRAEIEGLIGFFVNTLPLRADLSGDPTFRQVLARVREATLGAYANQDLPFERLVEELAPERSLGHSPVFQTVFSLESTPAPGLELPGIATRPVETALETSKFDLSLLLRENGGGVDGVFGYATDLFDAATIRRLAAHLTAVLHEVASDPERRLSQVELLGADERRRLVEEWSTSSAPAGEAECIHHAFERQARRTPDAVALVHGDERITFAELDRRANRLARYVAARGVGPDVRVGLCLERAPEMVVAMLGVLKAGGAYVPIDPEYPAERIALMAREIGAPLVLTQGSVAPRIPADVPTVSLDLARGEIDREPDVAPGAVHVTPEHLAYVLYTSGSTGAPKGSEIPHRAIAGFFRGADYVRFGPGEVLLQHSSPSWDAATLELWPALMTGATCVLYPPRPADPDGLAEQVRAHGVTTLWLPSALFNLIVDTRPEVLDGVRQVMVGGEAVSPSHVQRALERWPGMRLVNGYGPSECTVFSTCHVLGGDADAASVPIGRPVGDRRAYVLDRWMSPVPVGVPGELFVGGPGVPRGYLARPAMTAEKVVPDPFGEPGARLYRTGDRVRWRADGALEYLGRTDQQVKVRGFRIEPEEIEAVLLDHAAVREAVVVAREDEPGERRLVAYAVATRPESAPSPAELRDYLGGRLPRYMVPAAVVVLDALPLNANRKVDRRALPAPDAAPDEGYVAPRTPTETALAGIFAAVLKVERAGVHDDFFALGGHSLRATQVVSRARDELGVALPLRALFDRPTVAGLAAEVDRLLVAGRTMDVSEIVPVGRHAHRATLADLGHTPR